MALDHQGVCFGLNGQIIHANTCGPTTTLLDFLREDQGLVGTKEGCAEGDCGACTVTVGELVDGQVRYRAVNACIQFMPMLEGKLVQTVEGIGDPKGQLHACQRAMVDCHGSQCGFCTPGIVMSLHTAFIAQPSMDDRAIAETLAGNLCRCTGYGPIIQAARRMYDDRDPQLLAQKAKADLAFLERLNHPGTRVVECAGQLLHSPDSLDELCALAARYPKAIILGGATDIGLWVTKQRRHLDHLIWVGRVADMAAIRVSDTAISLGGAVTYDQLMQLAELPDELSALMKRIGGLQVRQTGTIGGNIANGSPIGDMPPALIALGARIVLAHGQARRELAIEDYFLDYGRQDRGPGEVLIEIIIPRPHPSLALGFYKISKRFDQDISTLCGCFALSLDGDKITDVRIAFGGMAGIPKRARSVEAKLLGQVWSAVTWDQAMAAFSEDFQPISDMRGSAEYRLLVARNLLKRFYLEQTGVLAKHARLDRRDVMIGDVN